MVFLVRVAGSLVIFFSVLRGDSVGSLVLGLSRVTYIKVFDRK